MERIKIPPLILTFIFALLMFLVTPYVTVFHLPLFFRLAVLVSSIVIALLFCCLAVFHFKQAKTTVNPNNPSSTTSLVTSGVFSISRNPMYVSFGVFLLGLAVYFANTASFIIAAIFFIYMNYVQIKREEVALHKLFKQEYMDYQKQVRRWL